MSYRTAARRVTMQSLVRSSPLKRRAADKVREVAQMIRRGERIGVTSASLIERLRLRAVFRSASVQTSEPKIVSLSCSSSSESVCVLRFRPTQEF